MLFQIGKKEVHFLMGAGASFASPDTEPFRVPLGKDLFDCLERHVKSWHLSNLNEVTKSVFRDDFERGMDLFFSNNVDPTHMQRDLAKFFLGFNIGPENIYLKLIDILEKCSCVYSFSTTNYELLIEQSLSERGKYPYYGIDIRTEGANTISVLKIHGSSNFIPDANTSSMSFSGNTVPSRSTIASYPAKAALPNEAADFVARNNGLAPSLAMYAKGKNVLHAPEVVMLQYTLWQLKLKVQCKLLVIVGLRVIEHDAHIWGFLEKEVNIPILYVGDESEFTAWIEKTGRKGCIYLGNKFENCLSSIEEYISGQKRVEC